MKNDRIYILSTMIGVVILAAGIFVLLAYGEPEGSLIALPYVCIGIGAGITGGSIGGLYSSKNKDAVKLKMIEEKDERNIMVRSMALSKTYIVSFFAYTGLILAFTIAGVDIYVIMAMLGVYIFVLITGLFYFKKYNKIL